ncbi:hypothetical protein PENTCL1PPCAC_25347, partial [Pristionchus entomophagus]
AWSPSFIPHVELRDRLAASVRRLHGTNASDFHVFGVPLKDENHVDAVDVAMFLVLPSFAASYSLFALSAFKIRKTLRAV